jgi:hypothetical protein
MEGGEGRQGIDREGETREWARATGGRTGMRLRGVGWW